MKMSNQIIIEAIFIFKSQGVCIQRFGWKGAQSKARILTKIEPHTILDQKKRKTLASTVRHTILKYISGNTCVRSYLINAYMRWTVSYTDVYT